MMNVGLAIWAIGLVPGGNDPWIRQPLAHLLALRTNPSTNPTTNPNTNPNTTNKGRLDKPHWNRLATEHRQLSKPSEQDTTHHKRYLLPSEFQVNHQGRHTSGQHSERNNH